MVRETPNAGLGCERTYEDIAMAQQPIIKSDVVAKDGIELESISGRELLRKIDWRLMPLMTFSYMIQFADKQTLAQTSIMGLVKDLKLVGNQYAWAGSIFYFGYFAATYPASLLMVRFPIGKYLAANFLVWGVLLACHAAVHNFTGLLVLRFLLGVAESSITPGFTLVTGMWYSREEQPLRYGIWFTGNFCAVMFSNLFAYGISHIKHGLPAWKWLFLLYAIITVVWGVVIGLFFPDAPKSARFLSEPERQVAIDRLKGDQNGGIHHKIKWGEVQEAFADFKIWMLFFLMLSNSIPNGGLTAFSPIILKGFGFAPIEVYLLGIPQGFTIIVFALLGTYIASRFTNLRCIVAVVYTFIAIVGSALIYAVDLKGIRLFGLFLFPSFVACLPLILSLVSSNVAGFTKKASVSGMIFVAYCAGNIIGPFLFFSHEAPHYKSGFLAMLVCFAFNVVVITAVRLCWAKENTSRDRYQAELERGFNDSVLATEEVTTDGKNKNFRYVY